MDTSKETYKNIAHNLGFTNGIMGLSRDMNPYEDFNEDLAVEWNNGYMEGLAALQKLDKKRISNQWRMIMWFVAGYAGIILGWAIYLLFIR